MEPVVPLARLLEDLERQLLAPDVRKSEVVGRLLAEEFVEFGSSGRQFSKPQIIAALQAEAPVEVSASDFVVRLLSPEVALITYRALRQSQPPVSTLRSSIWQQRKGHWQMVFHQGTRAEAQT
jgi:hypothetical protein